MGIKLVIVDDAPFIREAIRGLISGSEFECVGEATNGLEAVEVVRRLKPDLVIMDLVLPKKNGIEVTKEILEEMPKIKIVACSTEGQTGLTLKAIEAGCCHFISKPFTAESVLKILRAAMDQASKSSPKIKQKPLPAGG